ncbi:MAG: DUF4114 domain-containing protein [Bacteroidales bacterium]
MKALRSLLMIFALFALILAACEKDPVEDRLKQEEMIIDNDLSSLSRRVGIIEGGRVMPILPVDHITDTKGLKSGTVQSRYEIYLRAEVDPPVYEGKTLQASHIKIVGNNAFVTYNRQGPEYLGGVDVFDISDIENPVLIQGVVFPEKDISSIDIDPQGTGNNNHIYLTGAYNPDFDQLGLESPAVVERFIANKANQFMHMEDPRQYRDLPSYAGNDVRYHSAGNQVVYATSGSDGGLTILNQGMNQTRYIPISYARSIDTDGQHLLAYSAGQNKLIVMNMNGDVGMEIPTGGEHFDEDGKYLEAKSIVRLKDNLALVAAGTGGMEIYNIDNGEKVGSLPRPVEFETADTPLNYVTNGVSVNEKLVLVANGGSGVHIAEMDDSKSDIVRSIGKFMFEYGSSANFVEAQDNKVFVATGKGGLKILEIVELEPTEPCETLWDRVVELFPERGSIHEEDHPAHDLSQEGLPGTIELTDEAPVYITFLHNGAGWHNRFGYYAYHKDDVPDSPDDIEKNIIYSYVNENTNGEERQMGERVRLGGNETVFPAGTVIGFYIVADGWDPDLNQQKEPRHTVYTTPEFNPSGVRKHVLFLEKDCFNIVLGFEDMLDGSDEDFNDIIFTISNGDDIWGVEHNDAIDTEGLPEK